MMKSIDLNLDPDLIGSINLPGSVLTMKRSSAPRVKGL